MNNFTNVKILNFGVTCIHYYREKIQQKVSHLFLTVDFKQYLYFKINISHVINHHYITTCHKPVGKKFKKLKIHFSRDYYICISCNAILFF